jgi:hypothetical protein
MSSIASSDNEEDDASSWSMASSDRGSLLEMQETDIEDHQDESFLSLGSEDTEEDESDDDTTWVPPGPTRHENVFCDECGSNPVFGTRYKSTIQNNYDICQECLDENHNGDATNFVAFAHHVFHEEDANVAAFPDPAVAEQRSLVCYGLDQLSISCQVIQDPESVIDDLTIFISGRTTRQGTRASPDARRHQEYARRVLENHTLVKEIEIQLSGHIKDDAVAVALGLQTNRSLQSVAWTIDYTTGIHEEFCQAMKDLMATNITIRYMFVWIKSLGWINSRNKISDGYHAKNLEDSLFDGLQYTRLHTFRYNHGSQKVKDENKKKAWRAMKENPYLKRIKTSFENEDYMLGLLTIDKKKQWTNQWLQFDDDKDCWNVLGEALGECDIDPAFVIYHFLRSRPELVRP